MQNFAKIALNRVLTVSADRSRRELPESSGISQKGPIFVGKTHVILRQKNFGPNVIYCFFGQLISG